MVYPRFNTGGLSINDPKGMDQGLGSIFEPRGKKAPLQRYLRYFNGDLFLNCQDYINLDLRNGNHLFSTIIRKQAGGLKEDLEEI